MPSRFLVRLALALLLTATAARAQERNVPCVSGRAGAFPCASVDLLAHLPLADFGGGSAAEVWGWTDPETAREYALLALNNGVGFVDVTAPAAPVYLGRLPPPAGVTASTWRTLRTYGHHLFVGSEAQGHGVQVFDLTRLRSVAVPPQTFTADARYTGAGKTHTLVIDEATGYLYLAGANQAGFQCNGGGLHIVDVRSPLEPTYAGCFNSDGYTHEAQCLVYDGPDADHVGRELCVTYQGSGSTSGGQVSIVDVTDKADPTLIATGSYPNPGYSHQGWFTEDRRFLLVNDEFDSASLGSRTIVLDVGDLDNPTHVGSYRGPKTTYAHNLYVRGRFAFESNYTSGLHILAVPAGSPTSATEVGWFDTLPERRNAQGQVTCGFPCDPLSYNGQWMSYPYFASGIVVASDINNGLFVLRPSFDIVGAEPGAGGANGAALSAPAPNPFTAETRLTLSLAAPEHVRAEAYDALGRRVATLFDGPLAAGTHPLRLAAGALPPGIYVVRVAGETFQAARRVSLVR